VTLVGHEQRVEAFLDAAHSGRMHHAWLLIGPRGVGKAKFAGLAAARLLADGAGLEQDYPGFSIPSSSQTARLLEAGSHPDFMRLTRAAHDGGDLARNISVAQVRDIQRLFAVSPSYSERRILIIDAADDLERAAANALLKNLEEPPSGTVFFLISHAPGRLLPTIRSRCRTLRFGRLDEAQMMAVLRAELPEAEELERQALAKAGDGSPGRAIGFAGLDVSKIDALIEALIRTGDPTNAERSALARLLSGKAAQQRYEAFLERVPAHILDHAKGLSGEELAAALDCWEEARRLTDNALRRSLDPQATAFALGSLLAGLAP
jgi:DNA polymerase-3 subunit delta'